MSRIAYVDGQYLPVREAGVNVWDRGLQFGDSVYEVILVHAGRPVDEEPHLDRLDRSLTEVRMTWPRPRSAFRVVMREIIRRNRIHHGLIYLQVTRGVAPRDAAFPKAPKPTLFMFAKRIPPLEPDKLGDGVGVITVPDIRWERRDIKTTMLLPNVLAKQQAVDAGVFDAWMVDPEGLVTEGTASNAFIVTKDKELITRPVSHDILKGITRMTMKRLAERLGMAFVERPFTVDEAKEAVEAFLTNASVYLVPVTRIDDTSIGNGRAGSVTTALAEIYRTYIAGEGAS